MLSILTLSAFAEDGKVLKVMGGDNAYVSRSGAKTKLAVDTELTVGDEIFSEDAVLVIQVYPTTQISINKNSHIKIDQNLIDDNGVKQKTTSVIGFIHGMIRLEVSKDKNEEVNQKVQAEGIAFSVRGTDFEISNDENDDVDLDVHEGAVEASSPYVQTFVPEIIKAGKGFRYNRKQRNFASRAFGPRFKNHPGFLSRQEVRGRWMKIKAMKKEGHKSIIQEKRDALKSHRRGRKN